MGLNFSTTLRNNRLDQDESTIGTGAILKIFSGAKPANCAASDPAGLLATLTLPSDWMANASGGTKSMSGSWTGTASAGGTIASWRIYDSGLAACHIQGDTTDMTFNNTNVANGQTITITSFTLTAGNA
jgi:hypothetical protein